MYIIIGEILDEEKQRKENSNEWTIWF
jgi:hypothetical protein